MLILLRILIDTNYLFEVLIKIIILLGNIIYNNATSIKKYLQKILN